VWTTSLDNTVQQATVLYVVKSVDYVREARARTMLKSTMVELYPVYRHDRRRVRRFAELKD